MATDDILVRYRVEVDKDGASLDTIIDKQKQIVASEKEQETQTKRTATAEQQAALKRKEALKTEQAELTKLRQLRKLAYDPKVIRDYTKQIEESKKNITALRGETGAFGRSATAIFSGIGAALGVAFSVQAITNFGRQSVRAFLEAQENAERLRFAVTQIGGEGEAAFERLISQSAELQKTTIFSDDQIQQTQAILSNFDLTAQEIENLLPVLADYASQSKRDIVQTADLIGAAMQGNGREFKKYGIEVSAAKTPTENLAEVTRGLAQFQGAAAKETETLSGQLKQQANNADELSERIGSRLAPAFVALKTAALEAVSAVVESFRSIGSLRAEGVLNRRDTTRDRVTTDLSTQAELRGTTLLAEAQQEQLRVGEQLAALQSQVIENELRQNKQALTALERKRLALTEEAGILKEIIELETGRISKETERKVAEDAEKLKALREKQAKEAQALREKELEQLKKNLDQLQQLRIEAINDEKQRRIAQHEQEIRELQGNAAERGALLLALEEKLVRDLNEIDKKRNVDPLFQVPPLGVSVPDQLPGRATTGEEGLQIIEDQRAQQQAANDQIVSSTAQMVSEVQALYATLSQTRIDQIEREKNAKLEALALEQEAIEGALDRRMLSERDAEKLQRDLLARRQQAEADAARKSNQIKRRQFLLDRTAALAQAAINVAQGITKAIAELGALAAPVVAMLAALGAVQTATILAQPVPYAKGSKNTGRKGHMARVGEQGEELVYMPAGSKVLPNRQTRRYGELIDAMFDNRLEDYVMKTYTAPMLMGMKQAFQKDKDASFARNVAGSIINTTNYHSDPALARALAQVGLIRNADEVGAAMARHLKSDPFRR